LVSVLDRLPNDAVITWDAGCQTALSARWSLIQHLYEQRVSAAKPSDIPYYPVPVDQLFVYPNA
jgi:hypothetical protein